MEKSGSFQEDSTTELHQHLFMTITYEQIAKRAFEIWQKEGEQEGHECENWFRAEAELRSEEIKSQRGGKASSKDTSMMKASRSERF